MAGAAAHRFIKIILFTTPLLFISYILYFLRFISLPHLLYFIFLYPVTAVFTLIIWWFRDKFIERRGYAFYKYVYIGLGGWITWLATFFGGAYILWYYRIDIRGLGIPLWFTGLIFFAIPWIIGGIIGYYWGKRRGFKPYGL